MTKQHFIALADRIRLHNTNPGYVPFTPEHLGTLAGFCESVNPNFKRDRWLGYIAGTNGKNGGKVAA